MKRSMMLVAGAALAAMTPGAAYAYDWQVITKVIEMEPTAMPGGINFTTADSLGSRCGGPGNHVSAIIHGADQDSKVHNAEAIYALLLTAKSTGQPVRLLGYDNCTVELIYLTQ